MRLLRLFKVSLTLNGKLRLAIVGALLGALLATPVAASQADVDVFDEFYGRVSVILNENPRVDVDTEALQAVRDELAAIKWTEACGPMAGAYISFLGVLIELVEAEIGPLFDGHAIAATAIASGHPKRYNDCLIGV